MYMERHLIVMIEWHLLSPCDMYGVLIVTCVGVPAIVMELPISSIVRLPTVMVRRCD